VLGLLCEGEENVDVPFKNALRVSGTTKRHVVVVTLFSFAFVCVVKTEPGRIKGPSLPPGEEVAELYDRSLESWETLPQERIDVGRPDAREWIEAL